jgi:hypothetical protein
MPRPERNIVLPPVEYYTLQNFSYTRKLLTICVLLPYSGLGGTHFLLPRTLHLATHTSGIKVFMLRQSPPRIDVIVGSLDCQLTSPNAELLTLILVGSIWHSTTIVSCCFASIILLPNHHKHPASYHKYDWNMCEDKQRPQIEEPFCWTTGKLSIVKHVWTIDKYVIS